MSERLDRGDLLRLAAGAAAVGALPKAAPRALRRTAFPRHHPRWRFVFVNHALTNPFFVPAMNGSQDAASLLGVDVKWTGSTSSDVGQMVKAMRHAIATGADGIAVSIIDPTAFNGRDPASRSPAGSRSSPTTPTAASRTSGSPTSARTTTSPGSSSGARLVRLCSGGDVYLFIATPGQENIQPRIDGALDAIRDSGKPIETHVVASGVDVGHERKKIEATYLANKNLRGLFAVDAGSTAGVAEVMRKYQAAQARGLRGRLRPAAGHAPAIHDRDLDFTIDQQPYLQGFLPVLQMFLYRYSGHLVAPADTNTGLNFVTRANVRPLPDDEEPLRGKLEQRPVSGPIDGPSPPLNYSHRGVVFPCRSTGTGTGWEWPRRRRSDASRRRPRALSKVHEGGQEGEEGFARKGLILVLGAADCRPGSLRRRGREPEEEVGQRSGLRPAAGHAVVGPLAAVRQADC